MLNLTEFLLPLFLSIQQTCQCVYKLLFLKMYCQQFAMLSTNLTHNLCPDADECSSMLFLNQIPQNSYGNKTAHWRNDCVNKSL